MAEYYYENKIFEHLKLEETTIEDYEFSYCEFYHCTFEKCTLIRCSFSECIFHNCTILSPDAEYSMIKNIEFKECNLLGIHWKSVASSKLRPIQKLHQCHLKYNTFTDLNLTRFDFSDNTILDSTFAECVLAESSFQHCDLTKTEFFQSDLRKADFREATGYLIDIMTNKMKGARFSFPEVVNLLGVLNIKIE